MMTLQMCDQIGILDVIKNLNHSNKLMIPSNEHFKIS